MPQWYINQEKLSNADPSVIKIQGNIITPDYKIIDMIRQTQLDNVQIFRLDTRELEENISKLSPVKKVYVRRYWFPARLVITLDERTPAFLLTPNLDSPPNSALTTDGVLIDHDYLPFDPSIKAKKLLTYGVRNGLDEVWDKKRVEDIVKLTKAIEAYSNQQIQYIDLRNQENGKEDAYIMLQNYLIRFGQIDDSSLSRAKYIASLLTEAQKRKEKIKYIDMRWDDSYYFRVDENKDIESKEQANNQEKDLNKNVITDKKSNTDEIQIKTRKSDDSSSTDEQAQKNEAGTESQSDESQNTRTQDE